MLIQDQKIEIQWAAKTKAYYINKGYEFTKYGDKFLVDVNDLPPTVKIDVDVICDYCGKVFKKTYGRYNLEISKRIYKCACEECKGKKLKESLAIDSKINGYENFIKICDEKGLIPITTRDEIKNSASLLSYVCPSHGLQKNDISYLRTVGCHECKVNATQKKKATEAINLFHEICEERGYKPISTILDYKTDESYLYYECPIHGIQHNRFRDMKRGKGCPECHYMNVANSLRLTKEDVVDYIESKNGNKLLNPNEYIRAIENNLIILCGSCGNPFTCSLNNYQKSPTGKCSSCNGNSIGETVINDYLNELNINHIWHYSFSDCRDKNALPFDFYLPDYNCIIEFDGNHHFEPVFGEDSFKRTQAHDKIKNDYCAANNIKLIRIPYWEFSNIKPIISNALQLTKFQQIIHYHKNPYI